MSILTRRGWLLTARDLLAVTSLAGCSSVRLSDKNQTQKPLDQAALDERSARIAAQTSKRAREQAELDQLRGSVGRLILRDVADTQIATGSMVLLDNEGTVILCAHELFGSKFEAVFYLNSNIYQGKLDNFNYDDKHDLFFATLKPTSSLNEHLRPISWGEMGFDEMKEHGRKVLNVGFAHPNYRLTGTEGDVLEIAGYVKSFDTGAITQCKVTDDARSFVGMSGGGVFRDGKFLGIINGGNNPPFPAETRFTPADLIRRAYVELYPQRARRAGVKAPAETSLAPCRVSRRDFLQPPAPRK